MIVIVGATGNTGSVAAEKLLEAGSQVRVLGRDAAKLARFAQLGAEAVACDMTDAPAVDKAFAGASAVHALIPPNPGAEEVRAYQERVTDNIAAAIQQNKVQYAVVVSSTGAEKTSGTGPVVGLHNFEKKLEAIEGLNVMSLRCGYFMENLLAQVGIVQSFGFLAGPVRADLPLPMIATRDIGTASAELLFRPTFFGKQARELLGPRHLTYAEAAPILGAAIGKIDLTYRKVPDFMLKPALMKLGFSSNAVDLAMEMFEALNSGHMRSLETRSASNTTPTTLETFAAEVFAPAYRGKAAGA